MSSQEQLDAKRRRVSRACDTCRRKKVRCDGIQPSCTNCTTFGFQCTFNDSAKKRGPPKGYIEALENRLHRMENLLGGLVQTGERPKSDLDSLKDDLDDVDSLDPAWIPHSPDSVPPAPNSQPRTASPTPADKSHAAASSILYFNYTDSPEPEPDKEEVLPYDKDAREKINALSDSLDSMSLDDGGFVRYLGNSSGIDLLQKNQMLKNGYLMVPIKVRDHQEWLLEKEAMVTRLGAEMPLPPRDLAEHLIEVYFTHIHRNLPVLHRPSFMRQYRNPDPAKRPPIVLLNAMFAIASRFSNHPEITGTDPEAFGDEYFARAKRLVDLEYELPRQSSIQALLLMVSYRFTSAKSGGRVWVMLGMATRMAQDLGMHRSSARWHLPPLETEIRKRLWWTCYTMDRWVSASMGRPLAIDDIDCDVDYPSSIEQDWVDADGNPSSPSESPISVVKEAVSGLEYFVETIKLSQILGQILQRVYAATTRNHSPAQTTSTVAELDSILTKWLLGLPEGLKYDHQAVAAGMVKADRLVSMIHISYYAVLILLHRPYMVPTTLTKTKLSESLPSLNICVSAANSITHLAEGLLADGSLDYAWNFTTYEIFTSSLIHLTNSASIDIRLQTQARQNLVRSIAFMKKMGVRWFNAAKFSMILEDLMAAHLNFENYKIEGRVMEPVTVAAIGEPGSKYPIVLRDQHHPSGGTLMFAPKQAPQTPSSTASTPASSPSTPAVQHPESQGLKQETIGNEVIMLSESPKSTPLDHEPAGTPQTTPRPMKKSRKPSSQRNSLLFQSTSSTSPSPVPPGSSGPLFGTEATPFIFSSLTTPGTFAHGQAFMDCEQMIAQQQLQQQMQQQQQHQAQMNGPQQAFSVTPLFSSPLALQERSVQQQQQQQQQNQQQQQQPLHQCLSFANSGPKPSLNLFQLQQQQLQQQYYDQQKQIAMRHQQQQQQPQHQQHQRQGSGFSLSQAGTAAIGSSPYSNSSLSGMGSTSSVPMQSTSNSTLAFSHNPNNNSSSNLGCQQPPAIPAGHALGVDSSSSLGMSTSNASSSAIPGSSMGEDYSSLSLFPPQDGNQDPNLMAVPNPFFGIPNTIDWDEWNQYIASAGLQKL